MEFPVLKEILEAMRIHMLEIDGFEADDIIGTVAVAGEKAGLAPRIITGDKDALQLATDITKVIFTKRGISEFEVYDREAMLQRYGLTPEQFIDLKGLMGDASDNIPGIPGVGEKTATKLLLEYGSGRESHRFRGFHEKEQAEGKNRRKCTAGRDEQAACHDQYRRPHRI